jgi:hypothetical protein
MNQTTFSAGEYWLALHCSTTNTATGANTTNLGVSMSMLQAMSGTQAPLLIKNWGSQTANSIGLYPGQGVLSSGATRASLAFSDYTMTGTRGIVARAAFEIRNGTWQG